MDAKEEEEEEKEKEAAVEEAAFQCTAHDVLRELLWYVQKKTEDSLEEPQQSDAEQQTVIGHVIDCLQGEGILFWRDSRFKESQKAALRLAGKLQEEDGSAVVTTETMEAVAATPIDYACFVKLVSPCASLFLKAFTEEHVIPDWSTFTRDLTSIFQETAPNTKGDNAQYIPILKNADSDKWGLAVCSVDGQRFCIGDSSVKFSLQSCSKPVTYAMALKREGAEFCEQWIDCEPAGRPFNTQELEPETNRPYNASVNSGAIMAAGVVSSGFSASTSWREIVNDIRATWSDMCGHDAEIGFSDETFQSEKETAYNNFAIAYNLKGRRGLPRDVDLKKMLDVYLGCCSIQVTADVLSVAAATLANGGICPITGIEVFPSHVMRSVLAETMCCGMYDQSGRFAVEVGLPAKSGVSGAIMVIVPNVMGAVSFSPRLNSRGNSVRGYEFFKRLVNCYRLHMFEPLRNGNQGAKIDPRHNGWKDEQSGISHLAWAASVGDEFALRVRDMYLYALVCTALASDEGLSERKLKIIHNNYEGLFLAHLDKDLLDRIESTTKEHIGDVDFWKGLFRGEIQISYAFKKAMFSTISELIMLDNRVSPKEREVALRIADWLGVHENAAILELDRNEHHVGHRFENAELPGLIEEVGATSVHGGLASVASASRHSKAGSYTTPTTVLAMEREDVMEDDGSDSKSQKEAFELRRHIIKLGKRFTSMTKSFKRKAPKYDGYFE